MPEVPKDIAQWNAACLAKYILKQEWKPSGIVETCLEVMTEGNPVHSVPILCSYYSLPQYSHRVHPQTPPEIIAELKRRASLPS